MTELPSCGYTEQRCPDIGGMRTERTGRRVEERFLEMDWCQLLHREHCVGGFPASEGNIPSSCTDGRDVKLQRNRIETNEISAPEV